MKRISWLLIALAAMTLPARSTAASKFVYAANYFNDTETGWQSMSGKWNPYWAELQNISQSVEFSWEVPEKYRVVGWQIWDINCGTQYSWPYHNPGKTVTVCYSDLNNAPDKVYLVPVCTEIRYNLKYDANGGSWSPLPTEEKGIKYTEAKTSATGVGLVWEGHALQAFRSNTGKTIAFGAPISGKTLGVTDAVTDITLSAQWAVNQYDLVLTKGAGIARIYYKVNGAGAYTAVTASTTVKVDYGTTWYAYAEAEAGYVYTATSQAKPASGTMDVHGAGFSPAADAQKFTVSVTTDGHGKASAFPSGSVTYGTSVTLTAEPNAGYAFEKWMSTVGPSTAYENPYAVTITQDAQFQACFTNTACVVTFDPQGGTCSETERLRKSGEQLGVLPSVANDPYEFLGWYDDPLSTWNRYTQTSVIQSSITLYAHWSDEPMQCAITVLADPAKGGTVSGGGKVDMGGSTTISATAREGYTFKRWSDGATGMVRTLENVRTNATYTAIFEANSYTLVFYSSPGGLVDPTKIVKTITYDSPYGELPETTPPQGQTFVGWYDDQTAGNLVTADTIVKKTDATQMLYARYGAIPVVVTNELVYASGDWCADRSYTNRYEQGTRVTLDGALYARTGYAQTGWSKMTSGSSKGANLNGSYTLESDTTFYPYWTANTYTVAYDSNGGSGTMEAKTGVRYDEAFQLSPNAFTHAGDAFLGWATNEAGPVVYADQAVVSNLTATAGDTVTLYAQWQAPYRYTLRFDPNTNGVYGAMADLANCTSGVKVALPPCGYTNLVSYFGGWATNASGPVWCDGKTNITYAAAFDGEEKTLYAVWPGVGEMSTAVGLDNAVLEAAGNKTMEAWGVSTSGDAVECSIVSEPNQKQWANMTMNVVGPGVLRFKWKTDGWNGAIGACVSVNGTSKELFGTNSWQDIVVAVEASGLQTIVWAVGADYYNQKPTIQMSVSEVRWTPGERTRYDIMTVADPATGGEVSGGGANLLVGSNVVLTATAKEDYEFVRWSDGVTANPRTVEVVSNATYVAKFQLALSDLSKAVGLTNAVLKVGQEDIGTWTSLGVSKGVELACYDPGNGTSTMYMEVSGPGILTFDWYADGVTGKKTAWIDIVGERVSLKMEEAIKKSFEVKTAGKVVWGAEYQNASGDMYLKVDNVRWVPTASPEPTASDRRDITSVTMADGTLQMTFTDSDSRFSYQLCGTNDVIAPWPWPVLLTTNGTGQAITLEPPKTDAPQMFYYLRVGSKQQ